MAVRDRNLFAWQAYVITMAFLSVALLLGMFFLWRGYSDLDKRLTDAQNAKDTAQQRAVTSEARVDRLLSMLGIGDYTPEDLKSMADQFASDEKLSEAETDYANAMKLFDPNVPPTEKNLLKLPQYLIDTVRRRNSDLAAATAREQQLKDQLAATIQSEGEARKAAEAAQKQAEEDLRKARQEHTLAVTRLNAEKDEEVQKFTANLARLEKQVNTLRGQNRQLQSKNDVQAQTIAEQMDIINQFKNPDFASPQGKVTNVADGGELVWINLGSEDGLREGIPFSIIDESEVNISEANVKAKVVIVDVVDTHLSLARRTENFNFRNPIITGDKVYSPVWRPGYKTSFALVGMMDLNGDGKDDSDQVRQLIESSGGLIDDELNSDGTRNKNGSGMNPNTTFLVLGTDVETSGIGGNNAALQDQLRQRLEDYKQYMSEARQNGITPISLDKLMGYLKTEGADRTIALGNRIQSDDFRVREMANPPVSRGKVSEIFTPRTP